LTFSLRSRISSMPRLEAPSISSTSMLREPVISTQEGHLLQGVSVGPSAQLRALASTRAAEVLPTPRAPENR
jgi:hypothetical protein